VAILTATTLDFDVHFWRFWFFPVFRNEPHKSLLGDFDK
jgi:hypothetical protein